MSDSQAPKSPSQREREARLAAALRTNLRRRKAPPPPVHPDDAADVDSTTEPAPSR